MKGAVDRSGYSSSPQSRVERLIATGRVVLALASLLAIWLDPSEPRKYVQTAYTLLAGYVIYALFVMIPVWGVERVFGWLPLVSHIFDLTIFSLFMYFTEGPTSPFFVYFVFSVVCATLRWQWRGTLWTAGAALALFISMGFYAERFLWDPDFELNRFIIRAVYLAVVAALLGYMGWHEEQLRGELSGLVAWPRTLPEGVAAGMREVLERAGGILGAPRVLAAWQETEEPWFHLALWTHGECRWTRESPEMFQSLVAERLGGVSFICHNANFSAPVVLYGSPTGLQRWDGQPLHAELRARFAMNSVLAVSLSAESMQGYLFYLDKPSMTSDDLVLGEIVARLVAASMDHIYFLERLQQTRSRRSAFASLATCTTVSCSR